MILATWLSQAASEEQTSVLNVILKVYIRATGNGLLKLAPKLDGLINGHLPGSLSPPATQSSPCTYVSHIAKR